MLKSASSLQKRVNFTRSECILGITPWKNDPQIHSKWMKLNRFEWYFTFRQFSTFRYWLWLLCVLRNFTYWCFLKKKDATFRATCFSWGSIHSAPRQHICKAISPNVMNFLVMSKNIFSPQNSREIIQKKETFMLIIEMPEVIRFFL